MKPRNIIISLLIIFVFTISLFLFFKKMSSKGQLGENISVDNVARVTEIVDNDFMLRVLANDLTYSNLESTYSPKEVYEEIINDEYFKTTNSKIITFKTNNDDVIKFIKSDYKNFPVDMLFVSDRIVLDGNIKIGVSKLSLEKKFNVIGLKDVLEVSDLENGNVLKFIFDKDILIQIEYNAKYID